MAKFNTERKAPTLRKDQVRTTNSHGTPAYTPKAAETQLYMACVTNLISNNFYRNEKANLENVRKLVRDVAKTNPQFVAKLAIYCRETLDLRTVSLVLMVELIKTISGQKFISKAVTRVINRADEISEILAYYMQANKHENLNKLSKQLQIGVANAFYKFDEYQFSKYKRSNSAISLRDAMFVTHPKALNEEQAKLFKKIADNALGAADTWEVAKTRVGQETANKSEAQQRVASKETWEDMISRKKMGYMATIRNLNNFMKDRISDEHVGMVCGYITNDKAVQNSGMFPFQFYTAWKALQDNKPNMRATNKELETFKRFEAAVKTAAYKSLVNVALLDPNDRVITVADVSGSMDTKMTDMNTISRSEVARFYTKMFSNLNSNCNAGYFGTEFKLLRGNKQTDPFNMEVPAGLGHGTEAWKVFKDLTVNKDVYDKVVIFSDMQFWGRSSYSIDVRNEFERQVADYRAKINKDVILVLYDLSGYGNTPVQIGDKVFYMSGYSDAALEQVGNLANVGKVIQKIDQMEI